MKSSRRKLSFDSIRFDLTRQMLLKLISTLLVFVWAVDRTAGTVIRAVNDVRACPAGYFCQFNPLTRNAFPQACPPGTFSGVGATSCSPCKVGHWSILPASSFCELCPIGHFCANASAVPTACPLGTYNPSLEQIRCSPCQSGHYTPNLGSALCTPCPHGHSCSLADQQPSKCPPGSLTHRLDRTMNIHLLFVV